LNIMKKRTVTGDSKTQPVASPPDADSGGLDEATKKALDTLVQEAVERTVAPLLAQKTNYMGQILPSGERETYTDDPKLMGLGAARYIRALAFGKGDMNRAVFFAKKNWSDDLGERIQRDLAAGDFSAGGFMVPPEFANEIIEFLRARAIVRRAQPRVVPMTMGTLTLPKQSASASATYIGELKPIPSSEPGGGQIIMSAKKLAALVPVSNDLLRFTPGNSADIFVRDDLVKVMALREDQAFIRDNGTEFKPKGIRYWANAANITGSNGTTSADIEEDFKDLINGLEGNNVAMVRPVWFMHPRSKNHLVNLRDPNGNLIYPEVRGAAPTLYSHPVFVSTNIPANLGVASNESEVYLVDMDEAIIADSSDLALSVDSSASFTSGGNLVSSFERDETLVRAIAHHDFALRHDVSAAIKTGVTWGAGT
jgi:HK97 family phage major capsid protein